jgi:hypothetical protein
MTEKRKRCLQAVSALYLEVNSCVADDVKEAVLAALEEADTLTDEQVRTIFTDGVYAHPEFSKLEAENGTVTKQANDYIANRKKV